jgi:hypothetical protein
MKKTVLAIFFIIPVFWAAADEVGEISYLFDRATLVRNGKSIKADFGSAVENYDSLSTGEKGLMEISVAPETGVQGTIRVKPKSSLYLDISSLRSEQKGAVELLAGSVTVTMKKLSGKSEFEIRGPGITLGVRGTVFDVAIAPAGEVLVTCESGQVYCRDESGAELFAEPGTAVEKTPGEIFRNIPVAVSGLEEFRRSWYIGKIDAFKANAVPAIRNFADRYMDLKRRFDDAYRGLLVKRDVLDKWFREDARNTMGGQTEIMREKKELVAPLLNLRRVSFLFERVYFRLLELEDYHHQGFGTGPLGNGMTAEQFFRRLRNEAPDLQERMNLTRYSMKLYAKRNGGTSIFEELSEGLSTSGSSKAEEDKFFKN